MLDQELSNQLQTMLASAVIQQDGWDKMANDIERYDKIKSIIINAFEAITALVPYQVRITIQAKIQTLEETDAIYEHHELLNFLKLAQIHSTSLQSTLDDKKVPDYAAPHKAACILDKLTRINEDKYSERNVNELGAWFSLEFQSLVAQLEKIDWKKGWTKKEMYEDGDDSEEV